MDGDRILQVLEKISELKSKIIKCIHKSCIVEKECKESRSKLPETSPDAENQERGNDEEAESLVNIKDALQHLESLLFSLTVKQWYEKESALAEIESSQKKLLKVLMEYRGNDLDVIHEAIAFASETEDNTDLLLPPYSFPSMQIYAQNGGIIGGLTNLHGGSEAHLKSERNQIQSGPVGPFKRVKVLIRAAAKTALTVVGVIAILNLAGFEPRLRRRDNQFNLLNLLKLLRNDEKITILKCPPGKVPAIESGDIRCVVKERVEVPFDSIAAIPDVNFGCG